MKLASAIYDDFYPFHSFGLFKDHKVVTLAEELDDADALVVWGGEDISCLLYTSPSPRDGATSRMPSSA